MRTSPPDRRRRTRSSSRVEAPRSSGRRVRVRRRRSATPRISSGSLAWGNSPHTCCCAARRASRSSSAPHPWWPSLTVVAGLLALQQTDASRSTPSRAPRRLRDRGAGLAGSPALGRLDFWLRGRRRAAGKAAHPTRSSRDAAGPRWSGPTAFALVWLALARHGSALLRRARLREAAEPARRARMRREAGRRRIAARAGTARRVSPRAPGGVPERRGRVAEPATAAPARPPAMNSPHPRSSPCPTHQMYAAASP